MLVKNLLTYLSQKGYHKSKDLEWFNKLRDFRTKKRGSPAAVLTITLVTLPFSNLKQSNLKQHPLRWHVRWCSASATAALRAPMAVTAVVGSQLVPRLCEPTNSDLDSDFRLWPQDAPCCSHREFWVYCRRICLGPPSCRHYSSLLRLPWIQSAKNIRHWQLPCPCRANTNFDSRHLQFFRVQCRHSHWHLKSITPSIPSLREWRRPFEPP